MAALARIYDRALDALVAAGYAVIVVVGFAQVLFRFVFQAPLSWSEELIRYVFVWTVFLTAAILFRLGAHIEIDFLTGRYPPRLRRAVGVLGWACSVAAVALVLAFGVQIVGAPSVQRQRSPAMEVSMAVPYAAIPVGAALMLVNLLRAAPRTFRGERPADAALAVD